MIRPAEERDVAGVLAIERAAETAPHWAEGVYVAIARGVDEYRSCFVEEDGSGALRGFAVGHVVAGAGELESVAVAVQARRQGVGVGLCKAVLNWSAGRQAAVVRLEVRAASAGAIRLYEGLGFEVTGRRSGYYQAPEDDAVLMEMRLGSS